MFMKTIALFSALAFGALTSIAMADDAVILTDLQMDKITAGAAANISHYNSHSSENSSGYHYQNSYGGTSGTTGSGSYIDNYHSHYKCCG
jgi:hypothetical protein